MVYVRGVLSHDRTFRVIWVKISGTVCSTSCKFREMAKHKRRSQKIRLLYLSLGLVRVLIVGNGFVKF